MSSWSERASEVAGRAVHDVAQVVAGVLEAAGNRAQDALDPRGSVLGWLGGVASGVGDVLGALIVGIGSAIAGVLGGTLRVIGGVVGRDGRLIRNGLIDMGSGTLGGLLIFVGKGVSLGQVALGLEARKRRLSSDELAMLTSVFRESVALHDLRIIAGRSGAFRFTDRPFTLANTIYMKETGAAEWNHTLVHESTHVWQYQHIGSRYATDALGAQLVLGGNVAYDWQKALPGRWGDFNKEAQAQTVEDVYRFAALVGEAAAGAGAFFRANGLGRVGAFVVPPAVLPDPMSDEDRRDLADLTAGDFTELANDAVTTIRSRRTVRRG